ncbi:MAG: rod shape-determining protein RodA [Alphaproteobacteria bacterium]|jgi:rod shape determining protein RodA|nr:rod shape-determining protein RodA [Alphaproteobacteria bacterium]
MVYYKSKHRELGFFQKLKNIDLVLLSITLLICLFSIIILYSAGKEACNGISCQYGNLSPWANKQMLRFLIGFVGMGIATLIPIKYILKGTIPLYILTIGSLIYVQLFGHIGMGAQRWISLGGFKIQPSEIIKIALILVLAKQLSSLTLQEVRKTKNLVIPGILTLIPFALVLKQPDLGTSLILIMILGAMLFSSGVQYKKFFIVLCLALISLPVIWANIQDYQKQRVMTFLNPESDVLGAGYHITQAKIAMGSGGFLGKGYLKGSQSHLNFLPEKQTDFIFTMISEELGMVGGIILILLYISLIIRCSMIGINSRSPILKLMAIGISFNIFCYTFINLAMIMGLLPVVGVPLALVSYGGTSSVVVLGSIGIVQNIYLNRHKVISDKSY